MNYFKTWNEAIVASLQNIWAKIVSLVPEVIGALLILVVGLIVAAALGKLAKKLVHLTHVDALAHKLGATQKFEDMGMKFSISGIIGWIVKWFFIIVALIAAVDILKLQQVTKFLQDVALYIPNVVVAVVILVIGLVIGQFAYQVVEKTSKASHLTARSGDVLAAIAKWAIVIFALMASLTQLSIATQLIQILFTGFVAMLALALGLAFGLGGKEKANHLLEKLGGK
ncbi:hypothetical protein HYW83_06255 [Candidatus Peregrinibacteria bacterium]|nr:hypothetical protein [Candidatus Peregrinibacteria bacterium]